MKGKKSGAMGHYNHCSDSSNNNSGYAKPNKIGHGMSVPKVKPAPAMNQGHANCGGKKYKKK